MVCMLWLERFSLHVMFGIYHSYRWACEKSKQKHVQMRDGKVHAVVARSTFRIQNAQSAPFLDHFWKFRCRFAWHAQGILHLAKSEPKREGFVAFPKNDSRRGTFSDRVGRQPHRRSNTCSKAHRVKPMALLWLLYNVWRHALGMPDIFFQLCCRVCTVPCLSSLTSPNGLLEDVSSGCLLAIFHTCFLTVRSHGRCSLRPQTQAKKCWVLCTKGMALEGCLTFVSFGSYTTTEIRVCSRCLFFCANVNCLLSNCLDGKMKNHMDGWVKRLGT